MNFSFDIKSKKKREIGEESKIFLILRINLQSMPLKNILKIRIANNLIEKMN